MMADFTPAPGKSGVDPVKTTGAKTKHSDDEYSLKGTFASVLMLGGFIVVVWVAIFLLFLSRN
jgi:hypothetical protein